MKVIFIMISVIAVLGFGAKEGFAVEGDINSALDARFIAEFSSGRYGHEPLSRDTVEVIIGTPYAGNVIPFWGLTYDACRFQVLFLQNEIHTAGDIIGFSFMPSSDAVGTYNHIVMKCCYTNVSQLSNIFDDNYSGNTPVEVMNDSGLLVGGSANVWIPWVISFPYNNIDNLLVEIRWNGDNNINVPLWRTETSVPRRLYAWDDSASSGTPQPTGNYVKLTIARTSDVKEEKSIRPEKITLEQCIPNPSSSRTNIKYTLSHPEVVNLCIYNTVGRLIRVYTETLSYWTRSICRAIMV